MHDSRFHLCSCTARNKFTTATRYSQGHRSIRFVFTTCQFASASVGRRGLKTKCVCPNYRACRLVNKYLTKDGGYRTTLKRGEIKTSCHLVSSVPAYGVKERAEGLSSSVLLSAIGRRQTCGGKTRVSTRHLPGRDHGAQEHSVQYITVFPDELKWLFDSVRWNFPFRLNRYDSIAAFKPRW